MTKKQREKQIWSKAYAEANDYHQALSHNIITHSEWKTGIETIMAKAKAQLKELRPEINLSLFLCHC